MLKFHTTLSFNSSPSLTCATHNDAVQHTDSHLILSHFTPSFKILDIVHKAIFFNNLLYFSPLYENCMINFPEPL